MGWIGEMGQKKDPRSYGAARKALAGGRAGFKTARNYGGAEFKASQAQSHQHFGLFVVSCEKADLRPLPNGVMIYADGEQRLEPLAPPTVRASEVIDELYGAVVHGKPPLHGGEWAMATLEVCLAILESAQRARRSR